MGVGGWVGGGGFLFVVVVWFFFFLGGVGGLCVGDPPTCHFRSYPRGGKKSITLIKFNSGNNIQEC